MIQYKTIIHYGLHFIFPIVIAVFYNRKQWFKIYLVFIATMLIDLDHLIANPIFDANRCSINFHPLHSNIAIVFYFIGLFFKKFRVLAIGLLFHIATDLLDCYL